MPEQIASDPTAISTPGTAEHADIDRLTELVATVERVQRAEDVDGFLALFAEDAVWVNGAGRRLTGLDAIAEFTRATLPGGMAGGSVRYDLAGVRFLSPDLAITSIDQEYLSARGEPFAPRRQGRPTYVWARRGGDWRIVQGQNTLVVQPHDEASGEVSAGDEAEVRAIVADVERGFNTNDAELLSAHIAADAVIVNALGGELAGREEIERATREGLRNGPLRGATAHYRLHRIASPAPGVIVANKRAWSDEAAAGRGDVPEMSALYVFARRDGRWWIIRRQNTLTAG